MSALTLPVKQGHSSVNGLDLYYEIYGEGQPLVLLHGGGSTIQTSFERIIPPLAEKRQVIGVELQAHGKTKDRPDELSFEQDADDTAALLKNLGIVKADIFGFSNGGTTALHLAFRHPGSVNKIIAGSALCKRSGVPPPFWDFMKNATLQDMPPQYQEAYKAVAPDPGQLEIMADKCAQRMVKFKDISDEQLRSISSPVLIVIGDRDVITPEHAVEMHRLIPHSRLAIIPGGHGQYIGEVTTLNGGLKEAGLITALIEDFLKD